MLKHNPLLEMAMSDENYTVETNPGRGSTETNY
jgi:hypothetical protein